MRLHLVRHGRTASNVAGLLDTAYPGAELDDVGRAQAVSLVGRLSDLALHALYSSDLTRTQQTVAPLASDRELPVTLLPGLREIPAGRAEMSSLVEPYIGVLMEWATGRPDVRHPGGESGQEFLARFDSAVEVIASAGHTDALAVSHGAALRVWLGGRVSGLGPADVGGRQLGNTGRITIEGEPGDWRLLAWEDGITDDTPFRIR